MTESAPAAAFVSIVMAVYNGSAFIGEAIASVLAQTHRQLELIVVDDGSSDDTTAIVAEWMRKDGRIHLLRQAHLGHAEALNAGVAAAQGEFIARIDHDDLWYPQRLETQIMWMRQHDIDVCGSWARRFGTASGVIRFAQSHEAMRYDALFTCPILDSATLFRGEVLRANPYPPEAIVRQELIQCIRLLPKYRFANIPRVLCDYRFHAQQKTRRFRPMIAYRHAQLCQQHFAAMFPDAPADARTLFAAISNVGNAPLDAGQMRMAGALFTRFLCPPDREARQRMRRRWRRLWRHVSGNADLDPALYAMTLDQMR